MSDKQVVGKIEQLTTEPYHFNTHIGLNITEAHTVKWMPCNHSIMRDSKEVPCPYCRIAELGKEQEQEIKIQEKMVKHISTLEDAITDILCVLEPFNNSGNPRLMMLCKQYSYLAAGYPRESGE